VALPAHVWDHFDPGRDLVGLSWWLYALASLATLTLLLPLWQSWRRWGHFSHARKAFTLYLALELAIEVACFALGRARIENLWLSHLAIPVETALIIRAFSYWQVDGLARATLYYGAPVMLAFWLPWGFGWEPLNGFSIGTESIQAVLCLAVACYTVVRRSMDDNGYGTEQPWFWIGGGVMLYFATFALLSPLSGYLLGHSPDTAISVFAVRSGFQILANLLYFLGMRCPPSPQNSGPFMSPPRSSPSFWWSRPGPP